MGEYQGHRSRNAWNVALYIGNEEPLYRAACEAIRSSSKWRLALKAFRAATGLTATDRTPDGCVYNDKCVLEALKGLEVELKQ